MKTGPASRPVFFRLAMEYLILCILSSTGIFLVFKLIDKQAVSPLPVILINYFIAFVLGVVSSDREKLNLSSLS